MEISLILGLFLIGSLLIIVEFFFIPGNTVVGAIGIVIIAFGIYQVYNFYDAATGSLVLGVVLLLFLGGLIYAIKTRAWEKFSHKESIQSKIMPMDTEDEVVKGDTGEAVSTIRPIGKAMIKNKMYEVRSNGPLIPTGTQLVVIKVTPNKIVVEPFDQKKKSQKEPKNPESSL